MDSTIATFSSQRELPMRTMDTADIAAMRTQAFDELQTALPRADREAVVQCSARLQAVLPYRDRLHHNVVLVAYGGGKDSSYVLAFVRTIQLVLLRANGSTFQLRVATNRHAGMPRAVLENIDRAYRALHLVDDPDCQLLLIDADDVSPFSVDAPQRQEVVERNRLDILMTGHRTFADGRPTFCNSCNLSMVNSFGLAAAYEGGVDVIVTGDSRQEQRDYALWVRRLARRLAPSATLSQQRDFGGFLSDVDTIAQAYFTDIHGPEAVEEIERRRVRAVDTGALQFFSIFADTTYSSGDHFELLTDFLGFRFDDFAFSFTESDCGNPAVMAHLRGLKCERVYGRSYQEGMDEYAHFALGLMRRKEFPEHLVDVMRARYEGADGVARMRASATRFAREAYGLDEEQLVCMVHSPFAEKGAGLADFLRREHPDLAGREADVHLLLAADASLPLPGFDDGALTDKLQQLSGLGIRQLRMLYGTSLRGVDGRPSGTALIDAVLDGDPHKEVIQTRHSPDGPVVLEQISGR